MTDIEIMLAKANHTEEEHYKQEVNGQMESAHPCGDAEAIMRKAIYALGTGQPLPQEFLDFHAEAESRKTSVKTELGID